MGQTGCGRGIPRPKIVTVLGWIALVNGSAGLGLFLAWILALHGRIYGLGPISPLGVVLTVYRGSVVYAKDGSIVVDPAFLWLVVVPAWSVWSSVYTTAGVAMLEGRVWARPLCLWCLGALVVVNVVVFGSVDLAGIIYAYVAYDLLNRRQVRRYFLRGNSNGGPGALCTES